MERKEINKRYRVKHKIKIKESNKQYNLKNKKEIDEHNKQYRIEQKEEIKKRNEQWNINNKRNLHLKRKYNITQEQYNELFNKQNGKCAICGKHQSELKKALGIDHDHETGKNRGLLCDKCNLLLGHANDNVQVLTQAINYLNIYNIL